MPTLHEGSVNEINTWTPGAIDLTVGGPAPVRAPNLMVRTFSSLLDLYRVVGENAQKLRDDRMTNKMFEFLNRIAGRRSATGSPQHVALSIFSIWARQETRPVTVDDGLKALLPFSGMIGLEQQLRTSEREHLGLNWLDWKHHFGWDWEVTDAMLATDKYAPYQVVVEFFDDLEASSLARLDSWAVATKEHIQREGCLTDVV